jgi:hypothetical protein
MEGLKIQELGTQFGGYTAHQFNPGFTHVFRCCLLRAVEIIERNLMEDQRPGVRENERGRGSLVDDSRWNTMSLALAYAVRKRTVICVTARNRKRDPGSQLK